MKKERINNECNWLQIGAVLFGVAILIIAIYIAKTLNTATKTIDRVNKIIVTMKRT